MCGRFTLSTPVSTLARLFQVRQIPGLEARFNVAPTQEIPIIRQIVPGKERELALVRWGLIPSWAKDPGIGNKLINARAETVLEKPAYRGAFRYRRCLIPADGFYEWKKDGKRKQPYHFRLVDGQPFAFAGLWEHWDGDRPDHPGIESCTLLTTEANDRVRPIHDRMPVILQPEDYALWLDPTVRDMDCLQALLRPYDAAQMVTYPVGSGVNSPRRDEPELITPAEAEA